MSQQNQGRLSRALRLFFRRPVYSVRQVFRGSLPTRSHYRDRFRMTLKEWFLQHEREIVYREPRWMGVRIIKNPLDTWIYQEMIYNVRPDVILEIGSSYGGSTLYFANLLDLLGKGMVISVDIDRSNYNVQHPRIHAITGDSSLPEVEREIFELCRGKKVMVSHDSSHYKEKVLSDLRRYSPLVPVGSYFVVEDGIYDLFSPLEGVGGFSDGPLDAITEFLKENPGFEPDPNCERYVFTNHPMGFLKRVR
jgi:cephalosporin hydroxylase